MAEPLSDREISDWIELSQRRPATISGALTLDALERALVELQAARSEISSAVDLARSFLAGGVSEPLYAESTVQIARALVALYDRGSR